MADGYYTTLMVVLSHRNRPLSLEQRRVEWEYFEKAANAETEVACEDGIVGGIRVIPAPPDRRRTLSQRLPGRSNGIKSPKNRPTSSRPDRTNALRWHLAGAYPAIAEQGDRAVGMSHSVF